MNLHEFSMTGSPESIPQRFPDALPLKSTAAISTRTQALQGRRRITREQGRALESLGHAADYLLDSYVYLGPDEEILHSLSAEMEAIHLLVQARNRVLESLEIVQPVPRRFLDLFRRTTTTPILSLGLK
ncbi:MAG TPA: hypothetical protein VMU62_10005 [Acidobacteriaceae bacterium]|nr:hypothetical protein [Acidobacteriaceae bacterium]